MNGNEADGLHETGAFFGRGGGTAAVCGTNSWAVMQNPGTARCRGFCFWTTAVPDAGWLSGIGVSDRVNLFRRRAFGSRADFVSCTKFEDSGGGCKLPEDGC